MLWLKNHIIIAEVADGKPEQNRKLINEGPDEPDGSDFCHENDLFLENSCEALVSDQAPFCTTSNLEVLADRSTRNRPSKKSPCWV